MNNKKWSQFAALFNLQLNEVFYSDRYGMWYRITNNGLESNEDYDEEEFSEWLEADDEDLRYLIAGKLKIHKVS